MITSLVDGQSNEKGVHPHWHNDRGEHQRGLSAGLRASSDNFDVLRLNAGRSIGRDVVPGPQRGQIIVQPLSAIVGQRRICHAPIRSSSHLGLS